MGVLTELIKATTDKVIEDMLDEVAAELPAACKSASEEIRTQIVQQWFGGYAQGGAKTIASTRHIPRITGRTSRSVTCEVESYVDGGIYSNMEPPRARKYYNYHATKGDIPLGYEPTDWVLHLFHDLGYIALPPISTVSDWVNPNPIIQDPLSTRVQTSPLWQQFVPLVLSKL